MVACDVASWFQNCVMLLAVAIVLAFVVWVLVEFGDG